MSPSLDKQYAHLSPASCRSARSLLKITQAELAAEAKISVSTVRRYEAGAHPLSSYAAGQIMKALEKNGIVFVGSRRRPD